MLVPNSTAFYVERGTIEALHRRDHYPSTILFPPQDQNFYNKTSTRVHYFRASGYTGSQYSFRYTPHTPYITLTTPPVNPFAKIEPVARAVRTEDSDLSAGIVVVNMGLMSIGS